MSILYFTLKCLRRLSFYQEFQGVDFNTLDYQERQCGTGERAASGNKETGVETPGKMETPHIFLAPLQPQPSKCQNVFYKKYTLWEAKVKSGEAPGSGEWKGSGSHESPSHPAQWPQLTSKQSNRTQQHQHSESEAAGMRRRQHNSVYPQLPLPLSP